MASRGATYKELCFFYCKNKHNLNFIRSKRQLKGYKFDGFGRFFRGEGDSFIRNEDIT